MAKVSSLWLGGPLGYVQKLCLTSFVYYKHDITLYVYDMDLEVPEGVKKADASTIVGNDDIFVYHNQYAAFSDYFRYKMIQATGDMWVDADTLCLSYDFFEDSEFVFIKESAYLTAGGILKLPKDHEITKELNARTELALPGIKTLQDKEKWAAIGPLLLTELVNKFKLGKFAQPAQNVNVLDHWSKGKDFWDPAQTRKILRICRSAKSGTMFTGTLRATGFDTEQAPPVGSAIEHFAIKFGLL